MPKSLEKWHLWAAILNKLDSSCPSKDAGPELGHSFYVVGVTVSADTIIMFNTVAYIY